MSDFSVHDTITFAIRDKLPELWSQADDIADIVTAALKLNDQ